MEQYEGKVIRFTDYTGDDSEDGYIVGCEYDIGVTIVLNNNRGRYVYCLNGPSAMPEKYKTDLDYEYYNEKIENIIAMFEEGFFDTRISDAIGDKYNHTTHRGGGEGQYCAFNK